MSLLAQSWIAPKPVLRRACILADKFFSPGLWAGFLVHFHKHQIWDEFINLLYGKSKNFLQRTTYNAFLWLAAWIFPAWCVIFLREINVSNSFSWIGLVVPPLAYLGLALWFRRVDSSYSTPLHSAAQFYTALGLLVSAPATASFIASIAGGEKNTFVAFTFLQSISVVFYAFSAWVFKSRLFAHVSAWLSIIPFTVAWKLFGPTFTPIRFVIPWLILSSILLVIGFALDKNKTQYSHGPYLAGYALAAYALA